MQTAVAAMANDQTGTAQLQIQVVGGGNLVHRLPAPLPCPKRRQQGRAGVLLGPGEKRLTAVPRLEVGRPAPCLALTALGEIDGVRLLRQPVLDLQLDAGGLQPEMVPDRRHVAQGGGMDLVDGDVQMPVVGVLVDG